MMPPKSEIQSETISNDQANKPREDSLVIELTTPTNPNETDPSKEPRVPDAATPVSAMVTFDKQHDESGKCTYRAKLIEGIRSRVAIE